MSIRNLPEVFQPVSTCEVNLPSKSFALQHCYPKFKAWQGDTPDFSFGKKAFLDFEGEPVFAEIMILRLIEKAGWEGVWVSSYGGLKFHKVMPLNQKQAGVKIPEEKRNLLSVISQQAGGRGGCFDVFAWREDQILFCESKRTKRDRLQETQKRWIEAVSTMNRADLNLLVVEWSLL